MNAKTGIIAIALLIAGIFVLLGCTQMAIPQTNTAGSAGETNTSPAEQLATSASQAASDINEVDIGDVLDNSGTQ